MLVIKQILKILMEWVYTKQLQKENNIITKPLNQNKMNAKEKAEELVYKYEYLVIE